jgi:polyisoprenyl-phosphate glycosyltransferase
MRFLGKTSIPRDTGDYRILSRRAVTALKELREHHRFMKGLFTWIGYPQKAVAYERDARYAGRSKWDYWKLWNLALEGITSYTAAPLKLATYLGTLFFAFLYALFVIIKTIFFQEPVKGYPSLMVTILFLGGIQLMFIGMIGEYLGRTYDESKRRPLYFLKEYNPSRTARQRTREGSER